ncbi:MAG: hypothetical protein AABZ64_03480 [Nitrospinota bacterium]
MVTGCAPFFLLALAGVALGSWIFGGHLAARLMGLGGLALFLLYYALLNWTAQARLKFRREEEEAEESPGQGSRPALRGEARAEWAHYLRAEGRMLWLGVGALALAIGALIARRR